MTGDKFALEKPFSLDVATPRGCERGACFFSPDGQLFAAIDFMSKMRIWSTSHLETPPVELNFDLQHCVEMDAERTVSSKSFHHRASFSFNNRYLAFQVMSPSDPEAAFILIYDVERACLLCRVHIDTWASFIVFSHDGSHIATSCPNILIIDTVTGQTIHEIKHFQRLSSSGPTGLAISAHPLQVAVADYDGLLRIWNFERIAERDESLRWNERFPEPCHVLQAFEPTKRIVELPPNRLSTSHTDARSEKEKKSDDTEFQPPSTAYISSIVPSLNNRYILFGSRRGSHHTFLYDRASAQSVNILSKDEFRGLIYADFSRDSQWLLIYGDRWTSGEHKATWPELQLWRTSGMCITTMDNGSHRPSHTAQPPHTNSLYRASFEPTRNDTGDLDFALSEDRAYVAIAYFQRLRPGHATSFRGIRTTTDPTRYIRLTIEMWEVSTQRLHVTRSRGVISSIAPRINAICISPDDQWIALCTRDHDPHIYLFETIGNGRRFKRTFRDYFNDFVVKVRFAPSSTLLAIAFKSGEIDIFGIPSKANRVQDVFKTLKHITRCFVKPGSIPILEFTEDSKYLRTEDGGFSVENGSMTGLVDRRRPGKLGYDGEWICLDDQPILWLPPAYRPRAGTNGIVNNNWLWILQDHGRAFGLGFDIKTLTDLISKDTFF